MKQCRKKLLVADDVEINRLILQEIFQEEYDILQAEDGLKLLEVLKQNPDVDAILLDIVMPNLDGIGVLKELKRQGLSERIPVILITSETKEKTLLQGYDLGISDIIGKPFSPGVVRRRVQNNIELFQHRQHLEEQVYEQNIALGEANKLLVQQADILRQHNDFMVDTLGTIVEFRNGESGAHIKRMRRLTKLLLQALSDEYPEYRMPEDQIETISSAAAMHDIGKIAIPDSVLLKPGRLDREEFDVMKTHTVRGCELLSSLQYDLNDEYYEYCYEICRHHHERWDGKGYPDGLTGDQIPIWAQVVAIADVYEALTSKRVYKDAYSHEEAIAMITRGECGAFNPNLLQCFLKVADKLEAKSLTEQAYADDLAAEA